MSEDYSKGYKEDDDVALVLLALMVLALMVPGAPPTRPTPANDHFDCSELTGPAVVERKNPILTTDPPPQLWAILDEAAVRRMVGGPEVARAQLAHLIDVSRRPGITTQVLPFRSGAHAGLSGPPTGGGTRHPTVPGHRNGTATPESA